MNEKFARFKILRGEKVYDVEDSVWRKVCDVEDFSLRESLCGRETRSLRRRIFLKDGKFAWMRDARFATSNIFTKQKFVKDEEFTTPKIYSKMKSSCVTRKRVCNV